MAICGSSCLSNIPSVALMTPPPTSNTSTSFAVINMSPLTKNCAYHTRFISPGVISFRTIQTGVYCLRGPVWWPGDTLILDPFCADGGHLFAPGAGAPTTKVQVRFNRGGWAQL